MSRNYTPIAHLIKKYKQPQMGGRPKEAEPVGGTPSIELHEVVEHEITDADVKNHVEVVPETPTIPPDLKKAGVQTQAHPQFSTTRGVSLPLPEERIPVGLSEPVDSSFRWLAELARYVWQQTHGTIKNTHRGMKNIFEAK